MAVTRSCCCGRRLLGLDEDNSKYFRELNPDIPVLSTDHIYIADIPMACESLIPSIRRGLQCKSEENLTGSEKESHWNVHVTVGRLLFDHRGCRETLFPRVYAISTGRSMCV